MTFDFVVPFKLIAANGTIEASWTQADNRPGENARKYTYASLEMPLANRNPNVLMPDLEASFALGCTDQITTVQAERFTIILPPLKVSDLPFKKAGGGIKIFGGYLRSLPPLTLLP